MARKKKYSDELIAEAKKRVKDGEPRQVVADSLGIPLTTLLNYLYEDRSKAQGRFMLKRYYRLRAEGICHQCGQSIKKKV